MRINVVYSTQHWIVPTIVIGVLIILGAIILVTEGVSRIKAGRGFFVKPGPFFEANYDKIKFWGCLILTVLYFSCLDKLGFTASSILFVFLFNTLFAGKDRMGNVRYHLISLLISVVSTLVVSILFGTVFSITLPSGICTIEVPSMGLIIF